MSTRSYGSSMHVTSICNGDGIFLLLLVFWCFVIIPLHYPCLTICFLIRSFWEHREGGETRWGGWRKSAFSSLPCSEGLSFSKTPCVFPPPLCWLCRNHRCLCAIGISHPQWYRTKFDQDNAIHWDWIFGGGGTGRLSFVWNLRGGGKEDIKQVRCAPSSTTPITRKKHRAMPLPC